jgi:hypothetical protein
MFEKIGRLAETAANKVSLSRRGFFGRLGQGALAVGAVLGGFSTAAAGPGGVVCCYYGCDYKGYKKGPRTKILCKPKGPCDIGMGPCYLDRMTTAATCKSCGP